MPSKPQRAGDQPPPVPNDRPSVHDLVCEDLQRMHLNDGVLLILLSRRQVGLERYDSLLQAFNNRDAHRDLIEELADASVYARQMIEEHNEAGTPPGPDRIRLDIVYHSLLVLLDQVVTLSLPAPKPRYGDGDWAGVPVDGDAS